MQTKNNDVSSFVAWLQVARNILPPKMTLDAAYKLFLMKVEEDKELKNEKSS